MSTGHELGVDLAELWDAGQNHLPIVAGEFTKAVNALPTSITGIMYRSGGVGAGDHSYGSASAWGELAATLAGHLSTTADNLMDTGAALVHAANKSGDVIYDARRSTTTMSFAPILSPTRKGMAFSMSWR